MNTLQILQDIQEKLNELETSVRQNLQTIETLDKSIQSLIDEHNLSKPGKKGNNTLYVTVCETTFRRERDSVNTFLDVIDRIGIEKVKGLELRRCGNNGRTGPPLITTEREEPNYNKKSHKTHWRSRCDKYLVYAYGNAEDKALKLRQISEGLGIYMIIIVESPDGEETKY